MVFGVLRLGYTSTLGGTRKRLNTNTLAGHLEPISLMAEMLPHPTEPDIVPDEMLIAPARAQQSVQQHQRYGDATRTPKAASDLHFHVEVAPGHVSRDGNGGG
jgi:hypothetical protein